jgi:uncharacterized membrane protein YhaH (DUF805 family)
MTEMIRGIVPLYIKYFYSVRIGVSILSKRKKTSSNSYLHDNYEWQKNQYDPGYYTGGHIPSYFKKTGRKDYLGWSFIFTSILFGIYVILAIKDFNNELSNGQLFFAVFFSAIVILQLSVGIKLLKNAGKSIVIKDIKRMGKFLIVVIVFICLIMIIYKINEQEAKISIVSSEQIIFLQENEKKYIVVKDTDMKIKCTKEQYDFLYSLTKDENISDLHIEIIYKWNRLDKNRGSILRINPSLVY